MFSKIFKPADERVEVNMKTICAGHHNTTYKGIKSIRSPFDYVIYQMIISELKPDLAIEIGTNIGGGALYLADLMNNMGHGLLHTIDITKQSSDTVEQHPRIKTFTEGWENYDIEQAKKFSKVLVIEDASHIYGETLEALHKFAPIVSLGSYLIVEDGIIDELGIGKEYDGGPLRAIKEFLKTNNDFVVDRRWCDFYGKNATFNVNGYLKRIR